MLYFLRVLSLETDHCSKLFYVVLASSSHGLIRISEALRICGHWNSDGNSSIWEKAEDKQLLDVSL